MRCVRSCLSSWVVIATFVGVLGLSGLSEPSSAAEAPELGEPEPVGQSELARPVEVPEPASEPAVSEPAAAIAAGKIIEKHATLHDSSQQYALYLPTGYYEEPDRTWPVLFVLDPRGRAVPGIERFLPAADRHGYIVLSSYQSRSDTAASVTVNAIRALSREAQVRYSVNMKRMYLAGMSGTSHASWRLAQAMGESAAGVIGCVGGVQESTMGPPGEASFTYYGITSKIDFNYQETLRLEQHLLDAGIDHRIDIFDGRHGWSPHEHTNRALDWMELQAVKRGLAPANDSLIESEYQRSRASVAAAADTSGSDTDPLDVLRRHQDLVRDFDGLRDVSEHAEAVGRLEASSEVRARRILARKLAREERSYFAQRLGPFLADIENPANRPPTVKAARVALRLANLQKRAGNRGDPVQANSAQRVLESLYTSVAFYLPQKFEAAGDLDRAARALEVAIEIFPGGARTHWRLAGLYARAGLTGKAFDALRSATSMGRVDIPRLKSDPAWDSLRKEPEWTELLAGLTGS